MREEILKKARLIQLQTRRYLNNAVTGDYRTKQKGVGFEFDQLTDYQMGSDIRFIDWKSSARMNKMLVKEFKQERSRTIIIILDVSASMFFSSQSQKYEIAQQIAATLCMAGIYSRDAVGFLAISDTVELFIPPARGMSHGYHLMEQILSLQPQNKKTVLKEAFSYLLHVQKHEALVFLVSDCIDDSLESIVPAIKKKYDMVIIRCLDDREQQMKSVGFVTLQDLETNEQITINTRAYAIQNFYSMRIAQQNDMFKRYGIDIAHIDIKKSFFEPILLFFKQRAFAGY